MIIGIVNADLEPIISLSVCGSAGKIYEAVVVWDGVLLTIPVDEADSKPLVGMSLMEGYRPTVQVFEGGRVASYD
jgi:hypothetical protein